MISPSYRKALSAARCDYTRDEEASLVRKAQAGDCRAREALILSIQKLILRKISRYYKQNYFEDLLQAANEGALISLKMFDPDRGFRFYSYAFHRISREVMWIIRTSSGLKYGRVWERARYFQAVDWYDDYRLQGLTHVEAIEQIASRDDESVDNVERFLAFRSGGVLSADSFIDSESSNRFVDTFTYDGDVTEDDIIDHLDLQIAHSVLGALSRGNHRLTEIVKKRIIEGTSLGDLAKEFNVSRERVRQLEEKLLEEAQDVLRANDRRRAQSSRGF